MKRLHPFILGLFLLFPLAGSTTDIYVSPTGSDLNEGTKSQPLATVQTALRRARELRRLKDPAIRNGIRIILSGGVYALNESIFIRPEDSGTASSPTSIESAVGETPVLSGGTRIRGWSLAGMNPAFSKAAAGKIWIANIPATGFDALNFRQLWVNDHKAIRARDRNPDSMHRILAWNKKEETCWIPTPSFRQLENMKGLEMVIHQWWAIANLRIKNVEVFGDSTRLSFYQPESRIQSEHPWPAPWISKETGNSAFYLANALPFLDQPGEWYLDQHNQKIYYWPRSGEDMTSAEVIAPVLETLVRVMGHSATHPVRYVSFKGIEFRHTTWLRPSKQGHVPLQAGMFLLDAYKLKTPGTPDKKTLENQAWVGRPPAAVEVSYAEHSDFTRCTFRQLASTGLDYHRGTHHNLVSGNLFKDIGGNGILLGVFSDEAMEAHLPYRAPDAEVTSDIEVSNNLITDATNEDWGCVGIGAGYVKRVTIANNEVSNVSYTGISLGWGWTASANVSRDNQIIDNRIHHYGKYMYDVAGIYTLSAQPNSIISGNYVDSIYKAPFAHIPSHWFYIYTDEGSSHFTIKNNWVPSEKFLKNANGPGNTWSNNGPRVPESIKRNAGIKASFKHLLQHKTVDPGWTINREIPVMLEVVVDKTSPEDLKKLNEILQKSGMDKGSLYQWENHYVIFGKVQDAFVLKERVKNAFQRASIKQYDDLFYEFNRERCSNKLVAPAWDHILLTANLVDDRKLQQEYLDYHEKQFEQWPEVARGFCNASFQQLLLFRNDRQLMLVISIPKGEKLEKLNPLTTLNNPRVDEWNAQMKKYQAGIEGTKPGETWVFLKPIDSK